MLNFARKYPSRAAAMVTALLAALSFATSSGAQVHQRPPSRTAHYRVVEIQQAEVKLQSLGRRRVFYWVPRAEVSQRLQPGQLVRGCTRRVPTQHRTVRWCIDHRMSGE
jgi:hypothetical protein